MWEQPELRESGQWEHLAFVILNGGRDIDPLRKIEPAIFAEALQSPNPVVLLECLKEIRDSYLHNAHFSVEVLRCVLRLLDHPSEEIRSAAKKTLGKFGGTEECLQEMARHAGPEVRAQAEVGFARLKEIAADREEYDERLRRDAAKPEYVKVIEGRAESRDYALAEVRAALETAVG